MKMNLRHSQICSGLLSSLCTICAGLLLMITVFINPLTCEKSHDHSIQRQTRSLLDAFNSEASHLTQDGDNDGKTSDHTLEYKIGNLSASMDSKVTQLIHGGSQTMEKLQEAHEDLKAIRADTCTGSSDCRRLEHRIGTLSDILDYNVSQLIQQGLDQKSSDQALKYQIGNLSDTMDSKFAQLTQDGNKMKEALQKLESNLKALHGQTSLDSLQRSVESILASLGGLSSKVDKLSTSRKASCLPGWTKFGCSCYFFSSTKKSWRASKSSCEGKEAHLVVINNEEEQKFVGELTKGTLTWLGLTDLSGEWKWVDGTDYNSTPKKWSSGQPDNHHYVGQGFEDCAHLHQDGQWNDELCIREYQYLCEMDM